MDILKPRDTSRHLKTFCGFSARQPIRFDATSRLRSSSTNHRLERLRTVRRVPPLSRDVPSTLLGDLPLSAAPCRSSRTSQQR
ncbi:hypothetical protein VZT92_001169 [Zoarces viviparus]|uniref:Uncharacterized protein n=1 Tax=Zoarces viviparus TaxID=48416 RepID=A0AAW1G427_ZOAVI